MELLAGSLNSNHVVYKMSCVERGSEIEKFKGKWMKKASKIDYEPPEEDEGIEEK